MEFDTHATSDGELVVIHDETLDRTTDAAQVLRRKGVKVEDTSSETLRRLDAGTWKAPRFRRARIPTLAQTLRTLGDRALPMIERKGGSAALHVRFLRAHGCAEQVLLQSFDWPFVAEVRRRAPEIALGALGEGRLDQKRLRALLRLGVSFVHWDVATLRVEDVERLHAEGFWTCVYTANSDAALLGATALGVGGITTNVPARLAAHVRSGRALRGLLTRP